MDNVTHTLAGLLVGEGAVQLRRARGGSAEPSAAFRTAAWLAGAVAANLPDADVVAPYLGATKLEALLHHRGYTHTVVAGLAGAVLVWAIAFGVWRRRARGGRAAEPGAADRRWLAAVAVVAVLLCHLTLDWTNDYGVHVGWPANNRWAYGDAVFIIEPWLWAAAVPALWIAARRRAARVGLALVLAAGVVAVWAVPLVGRGAAAGFTIGATASVLVARRLGPGARAAFAAGLWLAVELANVAGTRAARGAVGDAVRQAAPGARLVDMVVTPAPGNPLCARAIAVETEGETYRVTTAWAAALPVVVPVARCAMPEAVYGASSLPMRPSTRPGSAAVRWRRTWEAPLAELVALGESQCEARAFLRFARVPTWFAVAGDSVQVGDARYDREPGVGFAEFRVARVAGACPRAVPPWVRPRADLLGAG